MAKKPAERFNFPTRLKRAKINLVLQHPFIASLLLGLQFEEVKSPNVQTAATDGVKLYYNKIWMEGLDEEELTGLLAHEVWHIAFLHPYRVDKRKPGKWNQACDYAINGHLIEDGFKIPKNGLFKKEYEGWSAEKIYSILPDQPEDGMGGGFGEVIPLQNPDGSDMSEGQVQEVVNQIKAKVIAAAEAAKACGKGSGGIDRLVGQIRAPKEPWWAELRKFLNMTRKGGWTWEKPSQRYIKYGVYIPSRKKVKTGTILCMVDTSGSVSQKELEYYAGHLNAILGDMDCDVDVLYIDTSVAGWEHFDRTNLPVRLQAKGGGGTDFRPGFKWAEQNLEDVHACIYFTDLQCNSYPAQPDYPVIWVTYEGSHGQPPFGEMVTFTMEDMV